MVKKYYCERCGRELHTKEEISEGLCSDCMDEEMDNFASAVLSTEDIPPNM